MFTYQTTIKMHETDAAGFLFFGGLFTIAHDAYEVFLDSAGFSISSILKDSDFLIPIVHAEADYYIPVSVSERITVQLQIENIAETSFSIIYDIINEMGKIIAHAKTVHAVIDKQNKSKMKIPDNLLAALNKFK
jgi:1,4-dihydroxy-2-naphthoyl-CoA hydrolase